MFRYDARAVLARVGGGEAPANVAIPATGGRSVATVAGVAETLPATVDPDAFSEAAAILEHDHGLPHADAEEAAAAEQGFASAFDLRAALIAEWRHGLEQLSALAVEPVGVLAAAAALRFLAEGWPEKALTLGWLEADLVGADARAPWARLDRRGAAYAAELPAAITSEAIVYRSGGDGERRVRRGSRASGGVLPWRIGTAEPARISRHQCARVMECYSR